MQPTMPSLFKNGTIVITLEQLRWPLDNSSDKQQQYENVQDFLYARCYWKDVTTKTREMLIDFIPDYIDAIVVYKNPLSSKAELVDRYMSFL